MTSSGGRWQLVIFDCDGVLVDSEPVANRILAEALQQLGLAMTYEEVTREFVGLSLATCMQRVEQRLGSPPPEDFLERLQVRTFEAFRRSLRPVGGIREALERIPDPTCVASSGEPEKMRLTLGLTGLLSRFEGRLFSAVEVPQGKPHPDLFLWAARRCGASPERCAVVEDSLPGVQAAVAAGMTVFGYASSEHQARLAAEGAHVFDDMRELPDLLARTARTLDEGPG